MTYRPSLSDQVIGLVTREFTNEHIIEKYLGNPSGKRLLHVGSHLGDFLNYLERKYPEVRAIGGDISPSRLEYAKSRSDDLEKYVRLNAGNLPFPDNSFDRVVAFNLLSYLQNRQEVFDEMWRVTLPGGVLLIAENLFSLLLTRKVLTPRELSKLIERKDYLKSSFEKEGLTWILRCEKT